MSKSPRTAAEIAADKQRLAEEEAALAAPLIAAVEKALSSKAFEGAENACSEAEDGLLDGPVKLQVSNWLRVTQNLKATIERATAKG
ncbi:hypothetical protein [Hyphobacterium sp.]|uniref:hypothetical protein n=1 Tax=Hyphobacterium sp. TaxID=2004662 RepID=UPI003B52A2C8